MFLLGGKTTSIMELQANNTFIFRGQIKISALNFAHFIKDNRHYAVGPSVSFICLMDITDPGRI